MSPEPTKSPRICVPIRTSTLSADQIDPFPGGPSHGTFAYLFPLAAVTYLHERQHKRELRLESAQEGTQDCYCREQAGPGQDAAVRAALGVCPDLQEKAVLDLAKENMAYYDHVIDVNASAVCRRRLAQVDLDRIELQRVQYESDLQTAIVNLRTAKIALLQLLNDRTPVDQFDVTGPFDFSRATSSR